MKNALFICLLAPLSFLHAGNLRLLQVEVENGPRFSVRFTIAWDNAWRNEQNHDAAWIFLKFQPNDPEYNARHTLVQPSGHTLLGKSSATLPDPVIEPSDDRVGVWVYPSKNHRGPVAWTLRVYFDPKSIGQFDSWQGAWQLYALEMVHIPEGGFTTGDPDTSALNAASFYRSGENGRYDGLYTISDEQQPIQIGDQPGNLCYRASEPEYQGDRKGWLPAAFPKGVQAFYLMKYEITQGQYAAFLNSLGNDVSHERVNFAGKIYYHSRGSISQINGRFVAGSPDRPLNFVGWDDGCAFSDWAGLRPMSELEFEKAARGTGRPLPHEYPWGTDNKNRLSRYVDTDDELKCAPGIEENQLNAQNRDVFGASPYWVMDLAGSLWERVVSVGHPAGRAFRGTHGDGRLEGYGFASNDDWPRGDHDPVAGFGYRGGGYYEHGKPAGDFNPHSPVGWRNFAAWSGGPRSIAYGFRCARTANKPASAQHLVPLVKDFLAARERKDEAAYRKMVSPDMRIWYEEKKGAGRPWNPHSPWARWDEYFNGKKTYGEFWQDSNAVSVTVTETNDFFTLIERPASRVQLTWWLDRNGKIEAYLVKGIPDPGTTDRQAAFETWARQHEPAELAYLLPDGRISPEGDRPERWKNILLRWRHVINAEKQIREAIAAFSRQVVAGDWAAVADAYTEDAKIFPPGASVLEKRAAIQSYWAGSPDITAHQIIPAEIRVNGAEAWDWGYYQGASVDKDGKENTWKGKYVIVWKETAPGVWKMYLDSWSRINGD
ncbi:MAG: SUMF1/EgtB/PvdO family nonheme iron enzyme [Saprospiraceae bacterium]|nr:SUMF1/EgtB/PvdO family nonheme iron enzyme [Saprospiraceae bacterium]